MVQTEELLIKLKGETGLISCDGVWPLVLQGRLSHCTLFVCTPDLYVTKFLKPPEVEQNN